MTAKTPILRGSYVELVPLGADHVSDDYVGWLNDPEVHRFLEVRFDLPQTRAMVAEYVQSFQGAENKHAWAMMVPADGRMIGTATIPRINDKHSTGDVGMMIGDKNYWGTKAAADTLDLLLTFGFERLGLHRMIAGTAGANHQSAFMLRRAGFRVEASLKQAYRAAADSDVFLDGYDFALLAEEWRDKRKGRTQP